MIILLAVLPAHSVATEFDWSAYTRLLQNHVQSGEKNAVALNLIDYRKLGADQRWPILLNSLSSFDVRRLNTDEEKLAFWINAYNILAIKVVLDHWPLDSIRDAGNLFSPVWKKPAAMVAGKMRSLHEIEHEILRPMGEPRIHFAIVCASVSCPDLKTTPYDAAHVHAQLETQTRVFLSQADKGMRIEAENMRISKIFNWFTDDFKAHGGVAAFIGQYRPDAAVAMQSILYLHYDWSLNDRPASQDTQ